MAAPENPLKAALAAGREQLGCWLNLASGLAAEMAGHAGFDWALVDAEHGPNDMQTLLGQLQALASTPAAPVVRVPAADPVWLKRVLDLGAQSVLVPMVESAAEAAGVVRAVRYPPRGMRGVGAGVARAALFGQHADYIATADDQVCTIVQIESAAALGQAGAIAALEGIDCVFIGPSDLAADMGHGGQTDHPDVLAAIAAAVAEITASGKPAGILALSPGALAHARGLGVRFLGVASDTTILSTGLRATAAAARSGAGP